MTSPGAPKSPPPSSKPPPPPVVETPVAPKSPPSSAPPPVSITPLTVIPCNGEDSDTKHLGELNKEADRMTFENGVKRVGANNASHAIKLTSVDVPEGVEKIGKGAFYGCKVRRRSVSEL